MDLRTCDSIKVALIDQILSLCVQVLVLPFHSKFMQFWLSVREVGFVVSLDSKSGSIF